MNVSAMRQQALQNVYSSVSALEKELEALEKKEKKTEKASKEQKIKLPTNPLLLLFYLEIQSMKAMNEQLKPQLQTNVQKYQQFEKYQKEIEALQNKLKKLADKDPSKFTEKDRDEATKLQSEITGKQNEASKIQQEEQQLWQFGILSTEKNKQSSSNMAAEMLQLLKESRDAFLSI